MLYKVIIVYLQSSMTLIGIQASWWFNAVLTASLTGANYSCSIFDDLFYSVIIMTFPDATDTW